MSQINIDLCKLDCWKDSVCYKCGRKYPHTILNIEGYIHYGSKPQCLDRKTCERIARKRKKN